MVMLDIPLVRHAASARLQRGHTGDHTQTHTHTSTNDHTPVCLQECGCCWLLFFRELLPAMLRQLAAAPREARRLPALLAAFVDGGQLLVHAASPTEEQLEVR